MLNTNTNVIVQPSLHANEGHIIVNESMLTIIKQSWTRMNGYFFINKRVYITSEMSYHIFELKKDGAATEMCCKCF